MFNYKNSEQKLQQLKKKKLGSVTKLKLIEKSS